MGVPRGIVKDMVLISPDRLQYLSAQELAD